MRTIDTRFENLTLADNFIFCHVMKTESICRQFLESLLGIHLCELEYIHKQDDLSDSLFSHGNILDLTARDTDGNVFNIEMQNQQLAYMPKRVRAYAAAMDRDILSKGKKAKDMPQNIVIVVCNYDPFEEKLAHYHVWKSVGDPSLGICRNYDDGTQVHYLNAVYKKANASENILDFLHVVAGKSASTEFGAEVSTKVSEVKNDNGIMGGYMTIEEYAEDRAYVAHEEGVKEGLEKGFATGLEQAIRTASASLQEQGMSLDQIAKTFSITGEELKRILEIPDPN